MLLDCAILIPFYRSKRWLSRCIESAIAQPVRWILLWDDGSDDGSTAIAESWAALDQRIAIQRTPNQGACAARNALTSWAIAIGAEWVQFIDSDDWIAPGKIQAQIEMADEDSEWLYCDQVYLNYGTEPVTVIIRRWLDPRGLGYPPHPGSWLLRTTIFDRLPGLRWDERFRECRNDLDFWLQGVNLGARSQHTPFVGSFYRAEWGLEQLTNVPAWHELDTIQSKFPTRITAKRSLYKDEMVGEPPTGISGRRQRYDTPTIPGKEEVVLIDVSPYTDQEKDWQRALSALEALSRRDIPCRPVIYWPYSDQAERANQAASMSVGSAIELRNFRDGCDHRVSTGEEDLPIAPLVLFDPPIHWMPAIERED